MLLELAHHGVEPLAEVAELVARSDHHAGVEISATDALHGLLEPAHASQDAPGDEQRQRDAQGQHQSRGAATEQGGTA
jgi:hypothetical protein